MVKATGAPKKEPRRSNFGALEAPEGSKKHIRGSKSILLRTLCERRSALAAVSGPKTPQKLQNQELFDASCYPANGSNPSLGRFLDGGH